MALAIETKNLRKEFGTKTAVKDITLSIEKGQIFSLLGVNGAGKTTTIRMLTGLIKPTSGQAFIFGSSVTEELEKVKQISGFSPQTTSVAENLTVWENLEFMARIYGMDKSAAEERAREMLCRFSMQEVRKCRSKILSGGWQRRLSIAMALIGRPKVLFLDEPTLGLDVLARSELWQILKGLKKNTTIVLTTHYMEEAEKLSDEVGIMVDGELRARGAVEKLKADTGTKSLEQAFIRIAEGGRGI